MDEIQSDKIVTLLKSKLISDAMSVDTIYKLCNLSSHMERDLKEKILKNNRYLHQYDRPGQTTHWIVK